MNAAIRFLLKSFAFSVVFTITVVLLSIPIMKMQEAKEERTKAQQVASRQKAQEEAQRKAAEQDADYKKDLALRDQAWKRSDEQFKRGDDNLAQMEALIKRQAALVTLQEANAKREATILAEKARQLGLAQGQ
ncbi:hypothetical protein SAMN05216345_101791 [Cupriavidus sp. YR651]|uniref:hypothetical protein n=1 Tax=Cupriavidus sp. YR651 TaxID=1855315 RepID=UPI0008842185|nr:hypothetical protein [Cupriavidus sp. YR651]SDC17059.1 hypothetical protein SAMN05216345_101791 [Cupriavidus sp. YR651]